MILLPYQGLTYPWKPIGNIDASQESAPPVTGNGNAPTALRRQ